MRAKDRCFVPNCKTGCSSTKRHNKKAGVKNKSLFRAPKNPDLLLQWQRALSVNTEKVLSSEDVVCELHFLETDILRFHTTNVKDGNVHTIERGKLKLKDGAIPCIFENVLPSSTEKKRKRPLVSYPAKRRKVLPKPLCSKDLFVTSLNIPVVKEVIVNQVETVSTPIFELLKNKLNEVETPNSNWAGTFISGKNEILFTEWNKDYTISSKRVIIDNLGVMKVLFGRTEIKLNDTSATVTNLQEVTHILKMVDNLILCTGINVIRKPASPMASNDSPTTDPPSIDPLPSPLKKPKLETESDDESSHPPTTSFAAVKDEFLKEEAIDEEEVSIKDEIIEEAEQASTSVSLASTQTDGGDSDRFKLEFQRLMDRIHPRKKPVKGPKVESSESHIFQFKISLVRGAPPPIWRRIQVPGNYTFRDLHLAIQKSMGWQSVHFDYHLHAFEMLNPETGEEDRIVMRDDVDTDTGSVLGEVKNEETTKIINYFTKIGIDAKYEYDFGVGWMHDVELERVFEPEAEVTYPRCVKGEKACPPEDGVVGSDEEYDSDQFDPNSCF